MIRFEPVPEPAAFATTVATPGADWLAAHADGRPKDFWADLQIKTALCLAFRNLCAYSAMLDLVGTVDHFVSCDEDRSRAYDWANYRWASGWLNSSKQSVRSNEILDPFAVGDDWFEILLPSLQLVRTDAVPLPLRAKADFVLQRLHLQHDERVMRQRRAWYAMYQSGALSLAGLHRTAPLIARAVERAIERAAVEAPEVDLDASTDH